MKQFAGDAWEALKITLIGLFMPICGLAITIKLLWEWRREKTLRPSKV